MFYAWVKQLLDEKEKFLPCEELLELERGFAYKKFEPRIETDFVKRKEYGRVVREPSGVEFMYKYYILVLASSREELANMKAKGLIKKPNIPKGSIGKIEFSKFRTKEEKDSAMATKKLNQVNKKTGQNAADQQILKELQKMKKQESANTNSSASTDSSEGISTNDKSNVETSKNDEATCQASSSENCLNEAGLSNSDFMFDEVLGKKIEEASQASAWKTIIGPTLKQPRNQAGTSASVSSEVLVERTLKEAGTSGLGVSDWMKSLKDDSDDSESYGLDIDQREDTNKTSEWRFFNSMPADKQNRKRQLDQTFESESNPLIVQETLKKVPRMSSSPNISATDANEMSVYDAFKLVWDELQMIKTEQTRIEEENKKRHEALKALILGMGASSSGTSGDSTGPAESDTTNNRFVYFGAGKPVLKSNLRLLMDRRPSKDSLQWMVTSLAMAIFPADEIKKYWLATTPGEKNKSIFPQVVVEKICDVINDLNREVAYQEQLRKHQTGLAKLSKPEDINKILNQIQEIANSQCDKVSTSAVRTKLSHTLYNARKIKEKTPIKTEEDKDHQQERSPSDVEEI